MPGDFGATSPLPPGTFLALSALKGFTLYTACSTHPMLNAEVKLVAIAFALADAGQGLA